LRNEEKLSQAIDLIKELKRLVENILPPRASFPLRGARPAASDDNQQGDLGGEASVRHAENSPPNTDRIFDIVRDVQKLLEGLKGA
jgi:hypothetical protein